MLSPFLGLASQCNKDKDRPKTSKGMQHLLYKKSLRELGLLRLEKGQKGLINMQK